MNCRLLDSIIEDLVVAAHRQHADGEELTEAANRLFALATRLDWIDELSADMADLRRRLPAGWERRLWEASTRAKELVQSGEPRSAAVTIREAVREVAVCARWRPLTFFGYNDIVYSDLVENSFLDRNRLTEQHPHLTEERIDEAHAWAEHLHDRLNT